MSRKTEILLFIIFIVAHVKIASASALFSPTVSYETGGQVPYSVVIADVNSDGKPDLIVANSNCGQGCSGDGSIGVLLGNGNGTFQFARSYSSGGRQPFSVAVADVNGDGNPDVLVGEFCASFCPVDGLVAVLLGNGDGAFQAPLLYFAGGAAPDSIGVADLNGDGKPDLVVAESCATVSCLDSRLVGSVSLVGVLLGNGDGTFQTAQIYASGATNPEQLTVADVNGDGKLDVIFANACMDALCIPHPGLGVISVLLGNGDGSFQQPKTYASGGFNAWTVGVGDINRDGKPDVVVANNCFFSDITCGNSTSVLLGKGDGTFDTAHTYNSAGFAATGIAVADVDGDGNPDLIVSNEFPFQNGKSTVSVLLGKGDGTFAAEQTYDSGGLFASSVAIGDLNGDGSPDVVTSNELACSSSSLCPGAIGVLLNTTLLCETPPLVTLSATPTILWPPNAKTNPVRVTGTISDKDCTIQNATFTVTDEYGKVQPSGSLVLGAHGAYSFTVNLQASRLGSDIDGRHYKITVNAKNNAGKTGSQSGTVTVPHDQKL
jgi:hypothetical protein